MSFDVILTLATALSGNAPEVLLIVAERGVESDAALVEGLASTVPGATVRVVRAAEESGDVAAMAAKCAELYQPALAESLMMRAAGKFKNAADRDVEDAPLRIIPAFGAYSSSVY